MWTLLNTIIAIKWNSFVRRSAKSAKRLHLRMNWRMTSIVCKRWWVLWRIFLFAAHRSPYIRNWLLFGHLNCRFISHRCGSTSLCPFLAAVVVSRRPLIAICYFAFNFVVFMNWMSESRTQFWQNFIEHKVLKEYHFPYVTEYEVRQRYCEQN